MDAVTGAGDRSTSKIPVQSFTHEVTMIPLLSALIFAVFVGQAHAQTADPPTFSVGDEWKLSTGFARRVVKVDGDVTVFQGYPNCPKCLAFYDKNLTLLKIEQEAGTFLSLLGRSGTSARQDCSETLPSTTRT